MGMFAKVIAFLDKAAGVPAWVIHADNIRRLEDSGCHTLVKAIVEVPEMGHVASWEPAQVWGILVQPDNWIEKVLSKDLFDQVKAELELAYEDLASRLDTINASMENLIENEKKVAEEIDQLLSPATTPTHYLDAAAKAQLLQGMMGVIARGRKPAPTLKVLRTMALGNDALVVEALNAMEAKGNTLAKIILEDPSL